MPRIEVRAGYSRCLLERQCQVALDGSNPRLTKTVVTRAGVSQRAFYEVFESAEECFSAAFEEGLARLSEAVEQAAAREQRWLDRVRAGLVALLGFLDDEPGWGRVLLFEAPLDSAAGVSLRAARAGRSDRADG